MHRISKHIEIVGTTIPGFRSMGRASRQAIFDLLKKHYTRVDITIINELSELEALVERRPDLIFLGMKSIPINPELGTQDPDKIWITDYLDQQGIAYTGSNQLAQELEFDKSLAKQRMDTAEINTSPFYVAVQGEPLTADKIELEYPLFVKPTNRGGGLGIDSNSVVHTFEALHAKVQTIAEELQADSLIEQYLPGREFSVAILREENSLDLTAMPIELVAPADKQGIRILSEAIKSADAEGFMAITEPMLKAEVEELALDAFRALGGRDYGRIDIRLNKDGAPQFLEANLIPSLIDNYGSFPKACRLNKALNYSQMILRIVQLALARHEDALLPQFDSNLLAPLLESIHAS